MGSILPFFHSAILDGIPLMWMILIIIPSLSFSILGTPASANTMKNTPPTNDGQMEPKLDVFKWQIVKRSFPSALMAVGVYLWSLALSYCGFNFSLSECVWGDTMKQSNTDQFDEFLLRALTRAQAMATLSITMSLIGLSASMQHRTSSIIEDLPFHHLLWNVVVIVVVVLQVFFCSAWVTTTRSFLITYLLLPERSFFIGLPRHSIPS
jgi:hypothetical protein